MIKKPITLVLMFLIIMFFSKPLTAQNSESAPDSREIFSQLKIIVIPYTKQGEDLRSKLESDFNLRLAIDKIKNDLAARGFTVLNLENTLKDTKNANIFSRNVQSEIKSSLIKYSGADIYIDVDINIIQNGLGKTARILLNAYDAVTTDAYTNITCDSREHNTNDIGALINVALVNRILPLGDSEIRSNIPCLDVFLNSLELKLNDKVINVIKERKKAKIVQHFYDEARNKPIDKVKDSSGGEFRYNKKDSAQTTDNEIPPISDEETYHAIFIACSNYTEGYSPLNTTIPEAKSLIKVLVDKYNFDALNIDTVFNKDRIAVLNELKNKLSKLKRNDNLIICYGGHGYFIKEKNLAYWVPLNAHNEFEYISNSDIRDALTGCQAHHILILADACFSGAMRGNGEIPEKYAFKYNSRQLLTSGGTESVPEKSVFIQMLLTALNKNMDKYLSVRALYGLIINGIIDQAKTEPVLTDFQVSGNEGGQFYFKMK